ncbi:MAG: aminopeptidase P family protein [Erysipelotrichaceae bacterium]|jgi:Xaa-Pro dipeptidase|nr:aminopeptidase P family protein [Erysipelotrichaceae bacterium]
MILTFDEQFKSFPKKEYELHVHKLQKEMKRMNLDMLLLTTPENIYYATGYRSWYTSSLFRPVYALVPLEGEPAIVLRILEKSTVKFTSWIPNIFVSGTKSRNIGTLDAGNHIEATYKAITSIYPQTEVIGLEKGEGSQFYWSLQMIEEFSKQYPEFTFADGTLAYQRARMIKSKWEIDRIRSVCYITERAIEETFRDVRPGQTTEKDVSRSIASKMAAAGVDKFSYLTVTSGIQKYSTLNAYATDRVIQPEEVLLVDISGHIDGYASDLTRMMYLGNEIPKDIREMAEISRGCVVAGKEFMKPGRSIGELNRVIERFLKDSPYGDYVIHSSGHCVGLNVVEYPMIYDENELLMEEGMVFAVENGLYPFDPNDGADNMHLAFRMEDQVLVTKDGAEWITGPGKAIYCLKDFKQY